MINFGRTVNQVVIPELSEQIILNTVAKAEQNFKEQQNAERKTALDFYYNINMDKHLEQWFGSDSLSQIPTYPQKIVPRFARARMMLYKSQVSRLIGGEENSDYKELTHMLDSQTKQFSELAWLLGSCYFKTRFSERHQRLEYEILPFVKEYYMGGESEPYGYSYEIDKGNNKDRMFVFWSEDRDGIPGMHFKFNQKGKRFAVNGNSDMINPYGVNPISRVIYPSSSFDVVRSAVQIGIAMTEIALSVRSRLGQPVFTGIDEGQSVIKSGIDSAIILPEGATFQYVSPSGGINEMIESVKTFANQTAENNHLRIRWGESSGNSPSGEALRILEIENLESRESDIAYFKEWEHERYDIDRIILDTHGVISLSEDLSIDFGEVSYPMSVDQELKMLDWKLSKGIMTKKELLLYFNPDMSNEELDIKMGEVQEEKTQAIQAEKQANQPAIFQSLREEANDSQ
ncbi:MAG: hypothetical protein Unbinned6747contig1000_10 [Prokaryotic dsDNA virus sp.]|nr:MAG: hypothetical protein Unbinned6747contig1000_10 [Prokaryotic dsDNA virus sp.]|tara:strand:+ start:24862 stop:26238 length:1377 start_codon:yes stop_codon:yes gene_type:complete